MKRRLVITLGLAGVLCLGAIGPEVFPRRGAGSGAIYSGSTGNVAYGINPTVLRCARPGYSGTEVTTVSAQVFNASVRPLNPNHTLRIYRITAGFVQTLGYEDDEKAAVGVYTCNISGSPVIGDCTLRENLVFYDPGTGITGDVVCAYDAPSCYGTVDVSVEVPADAERDAIAICMSADDPDHTADGGAVVMAGTFSATIEYGN